MQVTVTPQLTPVIIMIVIGAGALHATWNAITKHAADRQFVFAWFSIALTVAGGLLLVLTGLPAGPAIGFAVTSAGIHIGYELALMNSYRLGAFNQAYPIARGTAPLVVALGAFLLIHEQLSPVALAGVVALAVGLMSLAMSAGRLSRTELPAVGAAVLTGLTIAAYTIVDGIGVRRAGDPWAYAGLLFLLQGPVMAGLVLARKRSAAFRDRSAIGRGVVAGLLSLLAYGIVLWAQTRAPLAEVAAIRETSVVFAAIIGVAAFGEGFGSRRVAAAVVIAAGIVLIGL